MYWFHLTISRLPLLFFTRLQPNPKIKISKRHQDVPDFLGMTAICLSSKKNLFTGSHDIFLETKYGQNLSWGDRLATSKFHGQKCCTIYKLPTSQQATKQALSPGVTENNWHFKLSGLFLSGRCWYVLGNSVKK